METNENIPKIPLKFSCVCCCYNTVNKKDFNKHLLTSKHEKLMKTMGFANFSPKKEKINICKCGKVYKHMSSLCKHKNICNSQKENITFSSSDPEKKVSDDSLITILIEQCKELRDENKELIQIIKNGTHTTINNNKTFNLQFFLNETCKDAMNIMDFVDSIQLQLSDLENVGKLGYVEGISNIITKNLKALDVSQRPVHCADKKREVLYVKDENKWEKEDENKNKIRKAIKRVTSKNQTLIPKFKEAHPDCGEYSSLFSDQFDHIIIESMGGSGDNDIEKEDKIIRNISSVTIINK